MTLVIIFAIAIWILIFFTIFAPSIDWTYIKLLLKWFGGGNGRLN